MPGDVGDESCGCREEEESGKAGGLDCEGRSGDQTTDSGIFRHRARDGFRGSGGSGEGCRVLISGIEVGVKICFKICSEDCFEGEFQVISKVKGGVKVVVKDGQC